MVFPEALVVAMLSIFLFFALCGALVLIVISLRDPKTLPLAVATGLVVSALVLVAVSPINVSALMGLILALLAVAVAVLGGNPVTRRILEVATAGRVRETEDGGITITDEGADAAAAASAAPGASGDPAGATGPAVLRGGRVIGYLERLAVVIAIVAGFPEAIAVVVAVKGIGRFSELASAEARERFIIGTLASLVWACVVGALVRLAIW